MVQWSPLWTYAMQYTLSRTGTYDSDVRKVATYAMQYTLSRTGTYDSDVRKVATYAMQYTLLPFGTHDCDVRKVHYGLPLVLFQFMKSQMRLYVMLPLKGASAFVCVASVCLVPS